MNKNKITKTIIKALTVMGIVTSLYSTKALAYQDNKVYKEIIECKKYGDMYKLLSMNDVKGCKTFMSVIRMRGLKEDVIEALANKEFDTVSFSSKTKRMKFFKNNELAADIVIEGSMQEGNDIESIESVLLGSDTFSEKIQSYYNLDKGTSFEVTFNKPIQGNDLVHILEDKTPSHYMDLSKLLENQNMKDGDLIALYKVGSKDNERYSLINISKMDSLPNILVSNKSNTELIIYNKKHKEIECTFKYDINTSKTNDSSIKGMCIVSYVIMALLIVLLFTLIYYTFWL